MKKIDENVSILDQCLLFVFEILRYCAISLSRHENNRNGSLISFTGGNGDGGPVIFNSLWHSATIEVSLYLKTLGCSDRITAVQPPLAARGCQRHLKETSIGRIGMTGWKRSFLATRALNSLANINSQAGV